MPFHGGFLIPSKIPTNAASTLLSLFHLTRNLALTQQLHAQIIANGLHQSLLFGSKLSNVYIQLGFPQFATKTFSSIAVKNLHSYNTIASGFFKNKLFSHVMRLFKEMRLEGYSVDSFNLAFAIKSCLNDGKLFHSLAIKSGLEKDPYVSPALVDVYMDLGDLEDAHKLFVGVSERTTVIWGAMMKGYLKSNNEGRVFELLSEMRASGFELNPFTSECLVRAYGNVSAGKEGQSVHAFCIKLNFIASNICLQTSLVDMYLNCGLLDFGLKSFEEMTNKDVVSWTAIISGFAKSGKAWEAIDLFRQMLGESIIPNAITLASVLLGCSNTGSLQQGKSVHGYMIRSGVEPDVVNYTSLVDMYAKCGSIVGAQRVFKKMQIKNVFSYSAMVNAFAIHGLWNEALSLFDQMRSDNQLPNAVTFVSLLSALSHSGRVVEGWKYFKIMSRDYGITATAEHYACMVDLLGRAGKIDEALSFIIGMPVEAKASMWGALLSACRIHKRFDLVEQVAQQLLPLEPDKSSVYVLLCNIYCDAGMWESVKKIRLDIGWHGLHKGVGFASLEVDNKLHTFSPKDSFAHGDTKVDVV